MPLLSLFSGMSWMIPRGTNIGHPRSAPPEVKAACQKPTSGKWLKSQRINEPSRMEDAGFSKKMFHKKRELVLTIALFLSGTFFKYSCNFYPRRGRGSFNHIHCSDIICWQTKILTAELQHKPEGEPRNGHQIFIMDSGVLVYGDVTFDTVGCVHSEWLNCNTVNWSFIKDFLLHFSLEADLINSTAGAAGGAAVTEGYEPWQKTLIGASAGALSLVTIAGNLMVSLGALSSYTSYSTTETDQKVLRLSNYIHQAEQ